MASNIKVVPTEQQSRPIAPTDLDRKMHETMSAWYELQERLDRTVAQLEKSEAMNARLMHENEINTRRIVDLEHRLSYFMRHSTEVATRLVDVKSVMDMASNTINQTLEDARRAGYRPPPAGSPREPMGADDGEPVPGFLTKLEENIQQ